MRSPQQEVGRETNVIRGPRRASRIPASSIEGQRPAWGDANDHMNKAEKGAREILFEQMDQVDSRPHESDRQGDRGAQQGTETAEGQEGQPAGQHNAED
jgi:hypothetical protein